MSSSSLPAWSNPSMKVVAHEEIHDVAAELRQEQQNEDNNDNFLSRPFSSQDESVRDTIMRDLNGVWSKLKVVLMPLKRANPLEYIQISTYAGPDDEGNNGENNRGNVTTTLSEDQQSIIQTLANWDLIGPLIICLLLCILLSLRAPAYQTSDVFVSVFVSFAVGASVVTLNTKLLGSTQISFFQSVSVLGYCAFPFCVSAIFISIFSRVPVLGHMLFDIIWVSIGFVWAIRASTVFMGTFVTKARRLLAVFPVLFYYIWLGWLVLLF